jgi:hypothetical protein
MPSANSSALSPGPIGPARWFYARQRGTERDAEDRYVRTVNHLVSRREGPEMSSRTPLDGLAPAQRARNSRTCSAAGPLLTRTRGVDATRSASSGDGNVHLDGLRGRRKRPNGRRQTGRRCRSGRRMKGMNSAGMGAAAGLGGLVAGARRRARRDAFNPAREGSPWNGRHLAREGPTPAKPRLDPV